MYKTAIAAAVLTVAMASASALAAEEEVATITRITGDAVVSREAQYISGIEGMGLKVGERVMSLAGSTTVIQYKDGCKYTVEANELITIEPQSPCALGKGSNGRVVPPSPNLAWVPPVGFGVVAILGAALSTGSDDNNPRPAISQ